MLVGVFLVGMKAQWDAGGRRILQVCDTGNWAVIPWLMTFKVC